MSVNKSPEERIASLNKMVIENRETISDPQSEESLDAAVWYWRCWPDILGVSSTAAEHDAAAADSLRRQIAFTHEAAEHRLMIEAVRFGLDPSGFCEAGRICREMIYTDSRVRGLNSLTDTWPDFLGQRRYQLPLDQQQAITNAETLLRTLAAKADAATTPTTKETPEAEEWTIPLTMEQQEKLFILSERQVRRLREGIAEKWKSTNKWRYRLSSLKADHPDAHFRYEKLVAGNL